MPLRTLFSFLILLSFVGLAGGLEKKSASLGEVPIVTIQDSINPGSAGYLIEAIDEADKNSSPFLILQLDTPGGLLTTTRDIVKRMLNAKTPIVVFIGPQGARAGSAGALISFAADVVAMAPGTNIGAAHPVVSGGGEMDETMKKKMANDTAAFAESLAKAKGRNQNWARESVLKSSSIIAEEALEQNVIDLIATDIPDLLSQLVGFKLRVAKNEIQSLPDATIGVAEKEISIRHRLVSFFADPNLAYLIMSLGGLCIWIELTHPGLIGPGVIGVICIILSLISFQMLPISYGALAFIVCGLCMVVAELFLPTYGLLGVAGIASFIFGSLFLMDTASPEFQISLGLILPTAAVLAGVACLLGYLVVRSRNAKSLSGLDALVGEYGEVREAIGEHPGKVFVQGELWKSISQSGKPILESAIVVVTEVQGMVLVVKERET